MNKDALKLLKQHKLFTQYMSLTHNKIDIEDADDVRGMFDGKIDTLDMLNIIAIDLLESFLNKHNYPIEKFYKQTDCGAENKLLLFNKHYPCFQLLNYTITWSKTKEGRTFWRNLHNEWVEYIFHALLDDILPISSDKTIKILKMRE